MGRGKLTQQLRMALKAAQHLNRDVDMYSYEVPAVVAGGEEPTMIYSSTEGVRVAVRGEGCCPGRMHHRRATPKTLSQAGALYCRLCMVGARLPQPAGVRMPWSNEQSFMRVLWELEMDEKFMHQVVPQFWHKAMDFYNYVEGYCVQIDGACHWKGMHGRKPEQVLDADFKQAQAAVERKVALVRIHEADVSCKEVVAATLAAVQGFVGVVLSPSFARQRVPCQGQRVLYTQALVTLYPNLVQRPGPGGTVLLHKK
jgi:hypothetical protein